MRPHRCSIGGTYYYPNIPGPAVLEPLCEQPPTHRFRDAGMTDEHWGYRCATHTKWLDSQICTIEPLTQDAL